MNDPLNDHRPRNTIEPDQPVDQGADARDRDSDLPAGGFADRGMPALGQYRSARPRAWWLTPLVVILVAGAGAVWTVHTFLARHDAQAKARRDAIAEAAPGGRIFKDVPPSATGAASAPRAASVEAAASAPVANRVPVSARPARSVRSYYDAPLLATGATPEVNSREGDGLPTGAIPDGVASAAASVGAGVPGRATGASGQSGTAPLAQALTPIATPRVRASMLGDRSLMLAQGAKIDCAGDTAFDSTEAGISTCTVTKNVYSDDGKVVLIERGSLINSEYRSNLAPGQKRAFILAARIKTPDGVTVQIDSPAADALGRMGIDGYVDNHWGQRIGAALLLGMTQDAIGYLATRGGNSNSSVVYQNTEQQGNDMASHVLDRTINIPPTLTQNQGAEFTIVVARDLDFGSVYDLEPEGSQ
ncbi:type IV secretion system protein VirB10 [Paraburkholderia phenoliruptrix]|uniref:type IV secretion system protein VirB10 n=1 Tax=Paraburkholderia phenoliruptrix TaxID=252970 RepID=UPI002854CAE3|nr:type IV secretion system protein VirB10 [Paraburkholderia phenoliruptrix]MDR6388904.1 type IV secretion system protein VirB10 [Paraburkholderia phenoliruptrix]MDR6419215.1 type IV secretion system protein VirB10 [Paraburkholderia phenoliruptrix]